MNASNWHNYLKSAGAKLTEHSSLLLTAFPGIAPDTKDVPHIIPLTHKGLLRVTGPDSEKFLQGQLTCDLTEVTIKQSKLGAACNPQGRVYSNFRLFKPTGTVSPDYLLSMRSNMVDNTLAKLGKYSVFFKSELSNASDDWAGIGILGNGSNNLLSTLFGEIPASANDVCLYEESLLIKLETEARGYEFWGSIEAVIKIWEQLSLNATPTETIAHIKADIDGGFVELTPPIAEMFTPQALNLPANNAVSYTKGCYTGQEIVARMHYRGKAKTGLVRLETSAPITISAGTELEIPGENAKTTVLECIATTEGAQTLAVMPVALHDRTSLTLSVDGSPTECALFPFYSDTE